MSHMLDSILPAADLAAANAADAAELAVDRAKIPPIPSQSMIDAAPAMLAVLKKLRRGDLHQRVRHLYDEAQAAIKAAETGVKP